MPSATSRPARSLASPNIGAGFTSQHPTFYPPSYYAAANGFLYPQKRHNGAVHPSVMSGNGHHDTAGHYDHFMPVSYIPDTSSSESSFEIKRPPANHSNHAHASKSTKFEKRQSQITGLPQLEANLLPSLRDTVVRMTRPPPRTAPLRSAFTQDDDLQDPQESTSRVLHRSNNHPSDFSSNAHDPRPVQKRGFLSPRDPPPSDDSSVDSTPPKTKEFLRSTLRTPTPRIFQGQETPRADSGAASSITRPSPRPIKSILTRKSPMNITPTTASVGLSKNSILKSSLQTPESKLILPRSPSRADHHKSKDRRHHASAANTNILGRDKRDRSPRPERHLNSNIPRFRARPLIDHPQISFSDSSDLEDRYEQGRKEQRKLTVTNAGPPSNSSSSDHNHGIKFPLRFRQPQSRIGLGLNYRFPEAKSPRVTFDNDSSNIPPGYAANNAPRFSIVSFASSVSRYSTASDDDLPPTVPPKSDYERQREALLKIVSTLDQKPQRRATQSSEGSEYHGVEGVAYSASNELVAQDEAQPAPVTHSSNIKENRRRSQYMPGSLPLSVVESSRRPSPQNEMKLEINEVGSATAQLARRSLMIAAQEREAFGLRPSDSEEYRREYEKLRHHTRYESRLSESSVDDIDQPQDSALSHEASHMFHSIQASSNSLEDSRSASGNDDLKCEPPEPGNHSPALKMKSPLLLPEAATRTAEEHFDEPLSDVIGRLLETERIFVKQMQTCIQYYILPLRVHGSRAWISGVPPDISRFLDWYEDILHLHEQVLAVLRGTKSDVIRQFVLFLPRFEIYQPYIARLGEVSRRLRSLPDGESDFGCFVDLQDEQMQKSGWSLSRFISEPEKRLQEYFELFSNMLQITLRQDPQYIPTFSLVRSMELIVDVLTTVKQEELEHQTIVTLLGRFASPCSLGYLADRKRTLLWNGLLDLRWITSEDQLPRNKKLELDTRTRILSKAINAWDDKESDISHFDGRRKSFSSYGSASGCSMTEDGSQEGLPSLCDVETTTSIQVFASVFSDLVVFGEPVPGSSNSNSTSYRLLDSIGLARVFSVQGRDMEPGEKSSKPDKRFLTSVDSSSVLIEIIPVNSADASLRNMVPRIERIQISQPEPVSGTINSRNICQDCLLALRRSSDHTTQLWCRPWKTVNAVPLSPTSLGDSNFPFLRSPPGTQGHASKSRPRDTSVSIEEREERSWWSFRFHQVMTTKRQVTPSM